MADHNKTPIESRDIQPSRREDLSRNVSLSRLPRPRVQAMLNLTAPGSVLTVSSRQKRIVAVVDDDLGMRVSLAKLLGALGYAAETFDSAEAFLETSPRSKAGCLVLDIQLGDLSGIELARHLTAEGFKYPVIFITARDEEYVRRQAEAAGCVAFLIKPFAAKTLIDAINLATGWSIEYPPHEVCR